LTAKGGRKLFTIMIVPHSERSVYSFSIHLTTLQVASFILIVLSLSLLIFANVYQDMKANMSELRQVRLVNREQRQQLEALMTETDQLKANMQSLSELDRQIREILKTSRDFSRVQLSTPYQPSTVETPTVGGGQGGADYTTASILPGDDRGAQVSRDLLSRAAGLQTDLDTVRTDMTNRQVSFEDLRKQLTENQLYQAARPSVFPTNGSITSGFGFRSSPLGFGTEYHSGLDIAAAYGTPIIATGDGKVVFAGWRGAFGRAVVIDHGYGFSTMYGHTQKIVVNVGDRITKGQTIAYVGSSGRSTGPHLHYEVWINGKPVNPRTYIQ
jgi:murein DD-endopeptidase MepM/ murein hydrolase activator NlpD